MSAAQRRLLHDVVLRARDRCPHAPALEAHGEVWSYEELVNAAGAMALGLASARSRRIALISHPAPETYAAYLGILFAGRTVVPVHFQTPVARVVSTMSAAGCVTMIAPVSWPHADALRGAGTVVLEPNSLDSSGASPPFDLPADEEYAYILFTSGSTGVPKGVPVTHEAARAYIDFTAQRLLLPSNARVSQCFDLSFDVSVHDMFSAWAAGATLVVPTKLDLLDPVLWINSRGITHWASVPSAIGAALARPSLAEGSLPNLRRSAFLGEPLKQQTARAWALAAPNSLIENSYGPTELTIAVTSFTLPSRLEAWPRTSNRTVPIGPVYPHLEWKVVADESVQTAGEGELWVRGSQRLDGYLDPGHNANRFVGDHGTPADGSSIDSRSWYRTGDLVQILPEGGLVHLGRLDDQVKIRGFRVELGEIEVAVLNNPQISSAVALATPGRHDAMELTCCYEGEVVDVTVLREEVAAVLPPYMMPKRFVHIPQMPLTSSGKVDRNALRSNLNDA